MDRCRFASFVAGFFFSTGAAFLGRCLLCRRLLFQHSSLVSDPIGKEKRKKKKKKAKKKKEETALPWHCPRTAGVDTTEGLLSVAQCHVTTQQQFSGHATKTELGGGTDVIRLQLAGRSLSS